jgi:hypothetical protein
MAHQILGLDHKMEYEMVTLRFRLSKTAPS